MLKYFKSTCSKKKALNMICRGKLDYTTFQLAYKFGRKSENIEQK